MKHIVFVLGSYYPNYSAVGRCLGNIADILEDDYKITVVSIKTKYKQKDEIYYGKQKVIRLNTKYHKQRMAIDEKLINASGINKRIYRLCHLFLRFKGLVRTLMAQNALDNSWVKEYLLALNKIQDPIDVLIPTCSPFESIAASIEFKKSNPKVDLIPYLFDLFAENDNLNRFHFNKSIKKKNNIEIEKQMITMSKKIFHVANWTPYLKNEFPEFMNKNP